MSVSAQAQVNELYDSTKELATKISGELNISEENQIYLHRALYSSALSKEKAIKQYSNDPEMLESTNLQIKESLDSMLELKFTASQISAIKDLISAEAE
jgi:hypothetical protein